MAIGDVGGLHPSLIITCVTSKLEDVNIKKGDAVILLSNYIITNKRHYGLDPILGPILGQAMADCSENGVAIPVCVRGVCRFKTHPDSRLSEVAHYAIMSNVPGEIFITGPADRATSRVLSVGNGWADVLL